MSETIQKTVDPSVKYKRVIIKISGEALAKENGIDITEEIANEYFGRLHPALGELSDEELDNVAGGGCYSDGGRLKTTSGYKCKHYADGQSTYGIKGTCCRC